MTPSPSTTDYHSIDGGVPRGHRDFVMSQSRLKEYHDNAWKFINGYVEKETAAMTFGSLIDCLMFTPNEMAGRFIVSPYPDFTSNAAKCFRDMIALDDAAFAKLWIESPYDKFTTKDAKEWKAERLRDAPEASFIPTAVFFDIRQKYAAAEARCGGSITNRTTLVSPTQMNAAEKAMAHFKETQFAWVLEGSQFQYPLLSPINGIPFKGLIDILPDNLNHRHVMPGIPLGSCIVDFKICADASPHGFRSAALAHRYDIQGAIYQRMYNATHAPEYRRDYHVIIAMESEFPHACACYVLSEKTLKMARDRKDKYPFGYESMIEAYKISLDFNIWPDYNNGGPAYLDLGPAASYGD